MVGSDLRRRQLERGVPNSLPVSIPSQGLLLQKKPEITNTTP